jgi:hypothetical protein
VVSLKAQRQNQVLIAARTETADDNLLPLPGHTEAAITNWLHRRVILVGDFQFDLHTDTRPCAQVFPRLKAEKFNLPERKGDLSCHADKGNDNRRGSTRIDHALASSSLEVTQARHLYKARSHTLTGPANGRSPTTQCSRSSYRDLPVPARELRCRTGRRLTSAASWRAPDRARTAA